MSYGATVVHLLISCPSDIPDTDLALVRKTISQWNFSSGRGFGVTVQALSWSEHAVTEFGDRPQQLLNGQIVDVADMGLALFASRLGSPTGAYPSGTIEEIETLADSGKPVGILRNCAPRATPTDTAGAEELGRLNEHLAKLRGNALVLEYRNDAELVQHIYNLLAANVTRFKDVDEDSRGEAPSSEVTEGVWPRLETTSEQYSDNRGRLKTRRRWWLHLNSTVPRPVHDVQCRLENDNGDPSDLELRPQDAQVIATLPPNADVTYRQLTVSLGSEQSANAIVTWTDEGVEKTTTATVWL